MPLTQRILASPPERKPALTCVIGAALPSPILGNLNAEIARRFRCSFLLRQGDVRWLVLKIGATASNGDVETEYALRETHMC